MRAAWTVVGSSPEPLPMLVDTSAGAVDQKGLADMLTSIQTAGIIQEVNLRITTAEKACKQGIHPGFET